MEKRQEFRSLTALKGLFIWLIVLHNTFSVDDLFVHIPGSAFIRLYGGSLGNSMFFMLSGFLMAYGYRERIAAGTLSFRDFLLRRLKKLYPVYALSNGAALVVDVWQYGISAVNIRKTALTFLLLQGGGLENGNPYNGPTWFVSALLVCYILFYAGACRSRGNTAYYAFLAAGIAFGYGLLDGQAQMPFCFPENGIAYLNFFLGCALWELYPRLKVYSRQLKAVSLCLLPLLLSLMLRFGVEIITGGSREAFALVICPMILYLSYETGLCSRLLRWRPLVFLGKTSMGVFYWHLVLYFALRKGFGGMTVGCYGVYLLLVLLAGILTEYGSGKKTVFETAK